MADTLTKEERSERMARIRGGNTVPELAVRRLAHSLGYRFRLHRKGLPGKPDLVFPSRRKVVFVHGCFWHGHEGCSKGRLPKTRVEYWREKIDRNKQRDAECERRLADDGWGVLVVWQCETKDVRSLAGRLSDFLGWRKNPIDSRTRVH